MHARFRSPVHWFLPFVCLFVFGAQAALAADAPKKDAADKAKAEQDAQMAEMLRQASPGPMHALLNPLVGNWKTSTKSYWGPEPTVSEGTCQRSWIMGGRYLQSKHTGDMAGMPFEGMEILGYDNTKKQFTNVWVDNWGTMLTLGKDGQPDASGKVITINSTMDDPTTGKPLAVKMITTIIDANTNTFLMTCNRDGKDVKQVEITFTKVQ